MEHHPYNRDQGGEEYEEGLIGLLVTSDDQDDPGASNPLSPPTISTDLPNYGDDIGHIYSSVFEDKNESSSSFQMLGSSMGSASTSAPQSSPVQLVPGASSISPSNTSTIHSIQHSIISSRQSLRGADSIKYDESSPSSFAPSQHGVASLQQIQEQIEASLRAISSSIPQISTSAFDHERPIPMPATITNESEQHVNRVAVVSSTTDRKRKRKRGKQKLSAAEASLSSLGAKTGSTSEENPPTETKLIRRLTPEERAKRIERYRQKRRRFDFRRIRYQSRQKNAISRQRQPDGRFVKN